MTIFTIYRDCGRVPLGQADSLLGVVRIAESCSVGRSNVAEVCTKPPHWGAAIRDQDGTSILAPDRPADRRKDLGGYGRPS
jgi:hypothetical protein